MRYKVILVLKDSFEEEAESKEKAEQMIRDFFKENTEALMFNEPEVFAFELGY